MSDRESKGKPKILCLDDEPNVLNALKRQLHRDFEVFTATDARVAIQILMRDGPFPIVISDMRMPLVDGVSFLAKVADKSPDTVRILLTGYADLDSAMGAVNRGRVFRFLTKPCRKEDLFTALNAGLAQYGLVMSERELLDRTLRGAVRALTDILALSSPIAFGRAQRAQTTVKNLCEKLNVQQTWSIEVATLLSQIGCITLMPETLQNLHQGADLDAHELEAVEKLPDVARALLRNIPRLEPVVEILEHQNARFASDQRTHPGPHGDEIPLGSRLLKVALDLDSLELRGTQGAKAIAVLRGREGEYDPDVLEALRNLGCWDDEGREIRELRLRDLRVGMILAEDVVSRNDALLVARGQTISEGLLMRLRAVSENTGVREPILVAIPLKVEEGPAESPKDVPLEDIRFDAADETPQEEEPVT